VTLLGLLLAECKVTYARSLRLFSERGDVLPLYLELPGRIHQVAQLSDAKPVNGDDGGELA